MFSYPTFCSIHTARTCERSVRVTTRAPRRVCCCDLLPDTWGVVIGIKSTNAFADSISTTRRWWCRRRLQIQSIQENGIVHVTTETRDYRHRKRKCAARLVE